MICNEMQKKSLLSDVAEIRGRVGWKGYTIEDLTDKGPLVLGANDITADNRLSLSDAKHLTREKYEESPEIFVKLDDILVVKVGSTIGKVCIIDSEIGEASINPNCVIVRAKKINPYYLYYFLCTPTGRAFLINNSTASGQPALNQTNLRKLEVPIMELPQQNSLIEFLNAIKNLIIINEKIIEISEKLMREIYDYWFVQFDFPDENGRPYKSSGGEMVYDEILKREIPKGWKVQNLLNNDLASEIKPGISKFDGIKTYYATANIMGSCINTGSNIDYEYRESRANMQPIANSLWFAKMKNSIKHITVLPSSLDLINSSIFSTGFFGIRAKKCALPYLRSFLHSDYFEKVKDLNSNGATMEAISNDGIKNIKLLTPDKQALMGFADKTADLLNNMDILRQENKKLASLRDWLLPMLMNGQVMVDDRILNNNAPERVEDDNIGLY